MPQTCEVICGLFWVSIQRLHGVWLNQQFCLKRALSCLSQQHQQLIIISSSHHYQHHYLHLISSCKRLTKLKLTLCGTGSRWNWTVEDVANSSSSSSSISSCIRVLSRSQTCCLLPGAWQLCGFLCLSHGEVRVISMLTLNFLLQLRSGSNPREQPTVNCNRGPRQALTQARFPFSSFNLCCIVVVVVAAFAATCCLWFVITPTIQASPPPLNTHTHTCNQEQHTLKAFGSAAFHFWFSFPFPFRAATASQVA